jgi:hypothetical protein
MKQALFACAVVVTSAAVLRAATPSETGEDRMRYEDASGNTLLKLKPKESGYRLLDGADKVVGEVKVAQDRVKLKDANDVEIRKVKRKSDGAVEIEDAAGQPVYKIKRGEAGGWKIVSATDVTIVQCQPNENGFEMRDGAGKTLAKVKEREGHLAYETETGEKRAELKGTTDARAGMWMAAEPLTLAERAALVVYFREVHK